MSPLIRFPTVLLAILLGAGPVMSRSPGRIGGDGFVTIRGHELIGPDGKVLHPRGINLGGWLVPEGYMFGFSRAIAPWQDSASLQGACRDGGRQRLLAALV